ncbi:MAG: hypothetical protein M9928_05370 [Anaerolineae bacterium]|nr:hypothetical protein [Anaerolineae bacterium]MCO5204437.1 hypothetical protein [Anaerolineae bacterium]
MKFKITIIATLSMLLIAAFLLQTHSVGALSTGISGFSGKDSIYCNACHNDATAIVPTVTMFGPQIVLPGSTHTYTLKISGGQALNPAAPAPGGGLDVAASAGALSILAGATDTRVESGEITHTMRKPVDANGDVFFSFEWTAPGSASVETLYGAGNSVNGNGTNQGDAANITTLDIYVVDELPPPQAYVPIAIK